MLMIGLQPALHKELHPEQQALDLFFQKVKQRTLLKKFDHAVITKSRAAAEERQRGGSGSKQGQIAIAPGGLEQRSLSLAAPGGEHRALEATESNKRSLEKLVDAEYSIEDLRGAGEARSRNYIDRIKLEAIRK